MRARPLLIGLFAVAGCGEPADATPGTETGSCIEGQCLGGLSCQSDVCVSASATSAVGSSGDDNDDDNDDTNDDDNDDTNDDDDNDNDGPATGSTEGDDSTSSSSGGEGSEGSTDPDGPQFLSFGVDSTSLSQDETVTFVAVLTDPDGVADVVGGTLSTELGGVVGAFITSGEEGAYQLSITWEQLHERSAIVFDQGGDETRGFVAEFFDQAGHVASRNTQITLTCRGEAACDGNCRDLDTSVGNCGECDNSCPFTEASDRACHEGTCGGLTTCRIGLTCNEICQTDGLTCGEGCTVSTSDPGGAFDCSLGGDVTVAHPCDEDFGPGASWTCCCF